MSSILPPVGHAGAHVPRENFVTRLLKPPDKARASIPSAASCSALCAGRSLLHRAELGIERARHFSPVKFSSHEKQSLVVASLTVQVSGRTSRISTNAAEPGRVCHLLQRPPIARVGIRQASHCILVFESTTRPTRYFTVAVKTSSITKLVRQPAAAVWLSRLSVHMACETPPNDTSPS